MVKLLIKSIQISAIPEIKKVNNKLKIKKGLD